MRNAQPGSSRHSSTVRSMTRAPGSSPCSRRWLSVLVSTSRAPRRIAATVCSGDSLRTPARDAARTSSIPMGDSMADGARTRCRESPSSAELDLLDLAGPTVDLDLGHDGTGDQVRGRAVLVAVVAVVVAVVVTVVVVVVPAGPDGA